MADEKDDSTEQAGGEDEVAQMFRDFHFAKSLIRFPSDGETLSYESAQEFLDAIDAWRRWVGCIVTGSDASPETKRHVSQQVIAVARALTGVRPLGQSNFEQVDRRNLFIRDALDVAESFDDPDGTDSLVSAIEERAGAYGFAPDSFPTNLLRRIVDTLKLDPKKKRSWAISELTKAAVLANASETGAPEAWKRRRAQDVRREFDAWESARRARLKLSAPES